MDNTELRTKSVNKPEWDYTEHAEFYKYRPNYAVPAIKQMIDAVGKTSLVADIGAGTGNLTVLLLDQGLKVVAVEPNAAMRGIGMDLTQGREVSWKVGTGEATGLEDQSVELFAMGSSFNTTDRDSTLKEAHRVLKGNGWFACMWNHRDLDNDTTQSQVEKIIKKYVPDYSHGTRREDQTPILENSPLFSDLKYIEVDQDVDQPIDHYILAWQSVKNKYWDLNTDSGRDLFKKITDNIRSELPEVLKLKYTTRIWMVRKK